MVNVGCQVSKLRSGHEAQRAEASALINELKARNDTSDEPVDKLLRSQAAPKLM